MKKSRVSGVRYQVDEWRGCYPSNWKGSVVAEAMTHPAKYSSRLIRRIYEHITAEGWVKAGDGVIDPFGGVGLGALDAMRLGLHWTGVELEEKFWKIGNENISLWNSRFGSMPRWGSARLVNGDSRKLCEVIGCQVSGAKFQVSGAVSSPPYAETPINQTHMTRNKRGDPNDPNYRPSWKKKLEEGYAESKRPYGKSAGQLGDMSAEGFELAISSPPYAETTVTENRQFKSRFDPERPAASDLRNEAGDAYGETDGQLGTMPAEKFDVSISSPPFLQSEGGTPEPKAGGVIDAAMYERHKAGNAAAHGYGKSEGQLSSMDGEGFEKAVNSRQLSVSSPPYEGMEVEKNAKSIDRSRQYEAYKKSGGGQTFEQFCRTQDIHSQGYGESAGQLAQESGDDFWMAARGIVEQVYLALEPGGHACWVVKDYVKAKQVVPFADQWRQLCEAVGFETLHEHRAMLVHHKGRQGTLDGGVHEVKTESKSFFRRLAEKKGSPRIDWEVVWCMVKR